MRALVLVKHGPPEQALEVRELARARAGRGRGPDRRRAPRGSTSPTSSRASASTPTRRRRPCVMGYEVAGVVEAVGPGVDGFEPGQRVVAATRFNGFAETRVATCANVLPLPDEHELRAGRRPARQLRHRLRGDRADGERAPGRDRARARRRRRRRDRGAPAPARPRRRGDRHGVGLQARRDPRAGRRARDRLPHPGRQGRRSTASPAGRGSTSCSTRSGEFRAQLLDARARRAAGRSTAPRTSSPATGATSSRRSGRSPRCPASTRSS